MSVANENIEQLLADTRRLCMAVTDAAKHGYVTDGEAMLEALAHRAMASARTVEADAYSDHDPAAHLEAAYEDAQSGGSDL